MTLFLCWWWMESINTLTTLTLKRPLSSPISQLMMADLPRARVSPGRATAVVRVPTGTVSARLGLQISIILSKLGSKLLPLRVLVSMLLITPLKDTRTLRNCSNNSTTTLASPFSLRVLQNLTCNLLHLTSQAGQAQPTKTWTTLKNSQQGRSLMRLISWIKRRWLRHKANRGRKGAVEGTIISPVAVPAYLIHRDMGNSLHLDITRVHFYRKEC